MHSIVSIVLALSLLLAQPQTPKGYIALTFDDGPSGQITRRLLQGLEERQVQATFFLCCYRMDQYPQVLTEIVEGGHEIGLHSCAHKYMNRMTASEIQADLEGCMETLEEYTGLTAKLFRPPGGLYNEALLEEAKKAGLALILWSVDPNDWDPNNQRHVALYLQTHTGAGDIVLLHDLYPSSVDAALWLIDCLQAQGYRFCTVSQLAEHGGATLEPGKVYRKFSEAG